MSYPRQQPSSSETLPSQSDVKNKINDKFLGSLAAIVLGVVCLVLGMVFIATIATEERIVGYEENPTNLWQYHDPQYETYTYHPFWNGGVIILVLGLVLFIAGIIGLMLTL